MSKQCHIEVDNTSKQTECHIEVDNTSKQTECRIEVDNTSKQTEGNIEDATIEQVDNIIKTPTIHTKGMRKKTWNEEERSVITKEFPEYINSYKLPGKRAIEKLIAKEPSVLKERTWKNIKDFLHNYLVSKKRKQNKNNLE